MRYGPCSRRLAEFGGWLVLLTTLSIPVVGVAESSRVLSPGQVPNDKRLEPLKDLNGYFPFAPSSSVDEWNQRAEHVRRQLLVSLGIWPLPTRTPLNPVIHGKVDREDYTVERAYFESMPGFFVIAERNGVLRHQRPASVPITRPLGQGLRLVPQL